MGRSAQVALVTGASAGIGRACADRLAAAGWTVVGASRRGTAQPGWQGLVMNVDDDAAVATGVRGVLQAHGRIDALVAAAGWGIAGAVENTTVAEAKAQVETNFWGCVRAVQAVLPPMRAQGGGRIVLVSSIGGVLGIPFQAFYSASKFALEGLAEALAYEVAPFGIGVTLVQPGNIATDFTGSRQTAAAAAARFRRQVRRADWPGGQANTAVPHFRGHDQEQPRRAFTGGRRAADRAAILGVMLKFGMNSATLLAYDDRVKLRGLLRTVYVPWDLIDHFAAATRQVPLVGIPVRVQRSVLVVRLRDGGTRWFSELCCRPGRNGSTTWLDTSVVRLNELLAMHPDGHGLAQAGQ